jgi:perosamine synthetase
MLARGAGCRPPVDAASTEPGTPSDARPHKNMTTASDTGAPGLARPHIPDYSRFAIGFDDRDRARVHELIDEVFDSGRWSEGELTQRFEAAWEAWNGSPPSPARAGRAEPRGAALRRRAGGDRPVPVEHLHGHAAGRDPRGRAVEFVDCNREDLCMSFATSRPRPSATVRGGDPRPHRRPHRLRLREDRRYCAENDIFLIEDCAHAHGASWNGRKPGSYGDAGVYSLYATKTISTGEGGVLVSSRPEVLEHARGLPQLRQARLRGAGLNFRMNEFTAALGLVQIERLPEIVAWKNEVARDRSSTRSSTRPPRAPDGNDLRASTSTSSSTGSSVDRPRLRRALPPDHGPRRRAAQHRLGGAKPFVPAVVLPPRTDAD